MDDQIEESNESNELPKGGQPDSNQPNPLSDSGGISREMPRYQSFKKVWALKIKAIVLDSDVARETNRETDGSAMITPEEEGYAPFKVNNDYLRKHSPEVGGYYVLYEGGYKSFSPSDAFERGYTKIN